MNETERLRAERDEARAEVRRLRDRYAGIDDRVMALAECLTEERKEARKVKAERDRLRAEVAEQATEIARLSRILDLSQSAAYEVAKLYDAGEECWPAWFEGYGVDDLCRALWSHEEAADAANGDAP